MIRCGVINCWYVAEAFFEDYGDFPVCALHYARATRGVLEQMKLPGSYWSSCGRPYVAPSCEDLQEHHLKHRQALDWMKKASEDEGLTDIPDGGGDIEWEYDLLVER